MSRVIIYNADGSVASVSDSSANQGAAGPIAATTLGNSGDSNLSGNLTVAGTSNLKGSTTTANLNVGGTLGVVGNLTAVAIVLQSGGQITFPDGTTQSTAGSGGGGGGASGAINATSITNSGDTSLSGKLSVGGATTLNGNVSVARLLLQASGGITFSDGTIQTTAANTSGAISPSSVNTSGNESVGGNLTVQGTTTTKAISATSITTSAGISVGTTLAVTGNTTLATVTSGLITASNLTLSTSGKITFADGTTQSTAAVSANPGSAAQFTATSAGSTSAPAFTATSNTNSGVYFSGSGTSSAVNVAVNGNLEATVNPNGLVLASGNTLTFGDGTVQSTAAVSSNPGSSAQFTATSQGTANAPAFTASGTTNTGAYFTGTGTSSAVVFAANGSPAGSFATTGLVLPSSTKITFADGSTQATAATGVAGPQGNPGTNGTAMRYGYGPPTSSNPATQQDGDFYRDLNAYADYGPRASGAWPTTPYNVVGPTGPAGFTSLPNAALVPGPNLVAGGVTVSSTPYVMTAPGTTNINQTYYPYGPSALMGLGYVNFSTIAVTAELYDLTASKSIYTVSMAASSYVSTAVFSTTQYPMTAGNQHVWRLTGSGTATVQLAPCYLSASSTNTPCLSVLQGFTTAPSTAFSSTALDVLAFGVAGNKQRNVMVVRPTSVVGVIGNYTASAAGAAAASVTVTIGYYNPSNGSVTILFTTAASIPNTGVTTNVTPSNTQVGTYVVPAGTCLFARVQGSGTGQVNLDIQIVE